MHCGWDGGWPAAEDPRTAPRAQHPEVLVVIDTRFAAEVWGLRFYEDQNESIITSGDRCGESERERGNERASSPRAESETEREKERTRT